MLHVGIMPHHRGWGDFFANLDWVVVDEAHTYRGSLAPCRERAATAQAAGPGLRQEPRFVMASATIANPAELAERLTGSPARLIDEDGAREPAGRSGSGTHHSSIHRSARDAPPWPRPRT